MALVEVSEDTFNDTVTQEGIVLVDAWAEWCGPCKMIAPELDALAAETRGQLKIVKVNVDENNDLSEKHEDITFAKLNTEENQGLAAALEIQAIPTIMAFRDGIMVFRQSAALPPAALEDVIEQVRALDMDDVRRQIAEHNATNN